MKWVLPLALLIAAPAAAAPGSTSAARGDLLLRNSVVGLHNQARREFGVAPLAWSEGLAASALTHAKYMAATGMYGHDRTPGRRKTQGENIWRGQRGLFAYDYMVGVMLQERRNFQPGVYPGNSRTGNWADVSHYTQIVWPTTTEVGCALASSATTDYFVCRYAPTGNRDGVFLAAGRANLAEGGN